MLQTDVVFYELELSMVLLDPHHILQRYGSKLDRFPKENISMQSNWIEGTRVDFDNTTHQHILIAPGGGPALLIRTVLARPVSEQWNLKGIE